MGDWTKLEEEQSWIDTCANLRQQLATVTAERDFQAKRIEALRRYLCKTITKRRAAEKELAAVTAERDRAERALRAKGYRRDCDMAACNCGPQWTHGGHASERLREISEVLPYENGKTILERVEQVVKERDALKAQRIKYGPICLVCGAAEPCQLKDDPHAPCTFDPAPKALWDKVQSLTKELAQAQQREGRLREVLKDIIESYDVAEHLGDVDLDNARQALKETP